MSGRYHLIDAGRQKHHLILVAGLENRLTFSPFFYTLNIINFLIIFKDFWDSPDQKAEGNKRLLVF